MIDNVSGRARQLPARTDTAGRLRVLTADDDEQPRSPGRCCWCGEHRDVDAASWCTSCPPPARDAPTSR